ncbi:hypothetical protein HanXRQr2_Chr06g0253331 [Helianthus annuus]|uniref:Uncharacterized protein n=1 Tax=Helianthus annuus TaxID=4232 RepID=A0A9K3NJF5_HELAN|nr:hypothetical protein HanXRQr2_Chr06g0253331 [Helianthus annuus]KAJ0914970.1 hypothetical protein HanPSC8_Chr06g0244601 [Helianthus annuus]
MHASKDSFLQSSVRQRSFLSLLFRFGCIYVNGSVKIIMLQPCESRNSFDQRNELRQWYIHISSNLLQISINKF